MPLARTAHYAGRGYRAALRFAARPVRRDRSLKGYLIEPFNGYGTPEEVHLKGRVFRQPTLGSGLSEGSALRDGTDVLRRLGRWGLSRASVTARLAGAEKTVTTDRDGYFEVVLRPESALPSNRRWHEVELELNHRGETIRERGSVFVPPPEARTVVISDIDDTVVLTGVANVGTMLYRLFVQDAESRTAFPGVAALYRALYRGPSGDEHNPMLYVSRGPWSIYDVLVEFFRMHDIPEGPVLYLREWGLTLQRPLPRRAQEHKHDLIEEMLERYADLPAILIGDSGQHDPEIYAEIVHRYPGRIRAVYIRDVNGEGRRMDEIHHLAAEVEKAGSQLVLTSDSFVMAKHAAEHGYIAESDLAEINAERLYEEALFPS